MVKEKAKNRFGWTISTDKSAIELARFDLLKNDQERAAQKFGMFILEKKGWQEEHEEMDGVVISTCAFYVLTGKELRELIKQYGGHI